MFSGDSEVERLKQLLRDAIEVIEFDAENCDFGPAYGMYEERRKKVLRDAKKATK